MPLNIELVGMRRIAKNIEDNTVSSSRSVNEYLIYLAYLC